MILTWLAAVGGCALLFFAIADALDTVVLARRARHILGVTAAFYTVTWSTFILVSKRVRSGVRREQFLSTYGPLSLLALLALWALSIIFAFALLHWAAGLRVRDQPAGFGLDLFVSAAALVTMDIAEPLNAPSRVLLVVEAGIGFALLGLVVGYLPVLYQSFANREQRIGLLDARAGSPPAATEFLLRLGPNAARLEGQLASWEEWAANLLEAQLSYPMLAYFRSQHENQSWLSTLVAITDASALTILAGQGDLRRQAEMTFAVSRHALADFVTVFRLSPPAEAPDRLPTAGFQQVCSILSDWSTPLDIARLSESELAEVRETYEPFAASLSKRFLMALPGWYRVGSTRDNWLRTSWEAPHPPQAVSDPFQEQ